MSDGFELADTDALLLKKKKAKRREEKRCRFTFRYPLYSLLVGRLVGWKVGR